MKHLWADLGDTGPGVGVSNFEIQSPDVEMTRIWKSDYRVRVHTSPKDRYMNEAERNNSVIGDALLDGGTTEWERHKLFDGVTDEHIAKMAHESREIRF